MFTLACVCACAHKYAISFNVNNNPLYNLLWFYSLEKDTGVERRLCYIFLVTGDLSNLSPLLICLSHPSTKDELRTCFLHDLWSLDSVLMPSSSSYSYLSFPVTICITVLSIGCTHLWTVSLGRIKIEVLAFPPAYRLQHAANEKH